MLYDITYMWNLKKYNKLVNTTKKGRSADREKGQERQYGVGVWEVQTVCCKIGSKMYCITWRVQLLVCNNCEWNITFKIIQKKF